jgi:hypothetical protein
MEWWHDLLNSALLGTEKKQASAERLPADLSDAATLVMEGKGADKEEQFLQLAALAFNYRQCGVLPLQKEPVSIPEAEPEELSYCSSFSMQVLKDILDQESIPLLALWLQQCAHKQLVIQPDLLPVVLSLGVQHKYLQPLLGMCCGKRGAWLSRFNSDWDFSIAASDDEIWQTGSLEQRKAVLQKVRATHPAQAREWLQQTWPQEDANTKAALLPFLSNNISDDDIPFLEGLATEKGKKVKEEGMRLLKLIPGSAIIQQYWQVVRQSVVLKEKKSLLGKAKSYLHIQLSDVPEEVFKSGIEKLSNQKDTSDEAFILYQLIDFIPPHFWESHFNLAPDKIIDLFLESDEASRYLPAIGMATGRFKNAAWAPLFMGDNNRFYTDILPLLSKGDREAYVLHHFGRVGDMAVNLLTKEDVEWSMALTRRVIEHTAKNPYQFNRGFYNQHIHLLPVGIATELKNYKADESYNQSAWDGISSYVVSLLHLKSQLFQSFNDLK